MAGKRKPLVQEDAYDLPNHQQAKQVYQALGKNWSSNEKRSIAWPIIKTFWPGIVAAGLFKFLSSACSFINPIVLDKLLVWMAIGEPYWHGFFFAGTMFVGTFVNALLLNMHEYLIAMAMSKARGALTEATYQKALKLAPTAKAAFTTGEIVNLMAVDTTNISDFLRYMNHLWVAPFEIALSLYLLWQQLGIATLAGLAVMIFLVPMNWWINQKWQAAQNRIMAQKDIRSKIMNEILTGIKVLKLYAWELSFQQQVQKVRDLELKILKQKAIYMSWMMFLLGTAPIFVALFSFVTFVLIDPVNQLDASKAFVSLSLFNTLRFLFGDVPLILSFAANAYVSLKRLSKFLSGDELKLDDITHDTDRDGNHVTIKNGTFSWTNAEDAAFLKNWNLSIGAGKLVAVVGVVGSGKSSFMSALLGDMNKIRGKINISGSMAYVPQQAWIQNITVRENILFTHKFESVKYHRVLEACALTPDLKILSAGDQTEIGEKGINLSGGQKQRVSLARAVYANSDIYLLDDPLSAVDAHVGKHIFDEVIGPKGLLRKKTRILVTHKVAILPQVDEIIVLKDGKITEQGSYLELLARKGAFAEFLAEYLAEIEGRDEGEDPSLAEMKEAIRPELEKQLSKISRSLSEVSGAQGAIKRAMSKQPSVIRKDTPEPVKSEKTKKSDGKLIDDEIAATGKVSRTVYMDYFRAVGFNWVILIFVLMAISSSFNIASSFWLSAWSNDSSFPDRAADIGLRNLRLILYGVLGITEAIMLLGAYFLLFTGTVTAGGVVHNTMLERILRAPMVFFDTTPVGRLMNRFTKEIDTIDYRCGFNFRGMLLYSFRLLTTGVIIGTNSPLFLLFVLPFAVIYYMIQRYYIVTSRQLRRIESNARSPIYSHFGETVTGTTSIRAYNVEKMFIDDIEKKIDTYNSSFNLAQAASRWLSFRLDFLGDLIVITAALFAVFGQGTTNPSSAGLSISYAMMATASLNIMVQNSSELENSMVSVERCFEYTRTPTEAEWFKESTKPEASWPQSGRLRFEKYSTRYREGLELVVKKLSCEINAGEKVGIVGRTGAGKSSLTLALFRIIEPAGGSIIIDGVDISKLGLHDLRSKLTIIPQDPVLFAGTLRVNLDPFETQSDAKLWKAIELAHLKDFADTLEGGLDYKISEGGENLSVGQRQLVCLGRALLRKTQILILDEATAAVDLETDDLIQATVRKEFADATILTIAHRLNTILDYDKILVMDKGTVAEFDTPKTLLANTGSMFYAMAKDAGLIGGNGNNGSTTEINEST